MNFHLTSENLRAICKSYQTSDIAEFYVNCLKQKYVRHDNDLFVLDSINLTVKKLDNVRINDVYINEIVILLKESESKLNADQLLILQTNKEYSNYKSLSCPTKITKLIPVIDQRLKGQIYEGEPHEIHFKNGFINTRTTQFEKRTKYVLNYIDRNYKPSSQSERADIHLIVSKIYPKISEKQYILNTLGSAFSGEVKKDRTSMFLLGPSSAGKSLLMQMLLAGFSETYVREFSSTTFARSNPNRNKIMNQFLKSKQIRVTWVNELVGKIDDSLFKSFCEGSVCTTELYKDGSINVVHHSKVVLTSNEMPSIKMDTGVASRIVSYNHVAHFTEDVNKVDYSKYIFQKDKDLLSKINNSDILKNAVVDIILSYTKRWFEKGLGPLPESMKTAKNDIVDSNDCVQDFIDRCLEKDENGRIGKQEMRDAYVAMFKDKKISVLQMISAMRDKMIEYKNDLRCNSVKGCFVGYSFKDEESSDALKYSGCSEKEKRVMLSEIEQLKKELADLKKATCNNADQVIEVKKIVTCKPVIKKLFQNTEDQTKLSKKGKMDDHISDLDDLFMNSLF